MTYGHAAKERPCVVCDGAGGWDRSTGRALSQPLPDAPAWRWDEWQRCFWCHGARAEPQAKS